VLRLLRALARPAGLVVVLEDLHWSDPDTLAVVELPQWQLGDGTGAVPGNNPYLANGEAWM